MDILQPKIVSIGKRRYRRNPVNVNSSRHYEEEECYVPAATTAVNVRSFSYEDEPSCQYSRQIEEENDKDIQTDSKTGQFRLELPVASALFGYIIGKGGDQKRRLESDTKTTIQIPQRNASEDVPLVIHGATKSNIISCKNRLMVIVSTARQKQQFNHLLTFPLGFEALKSKVREFKEKVVEACSADRGVDASVFVNQNKLHLTLGILVLFNEKEKNEAASLLDDCNKKYVKPLLNGKPLKIHLKGLEYMNDDPGSVDVLYIKVKTVSDDSKDLIQMISDHVVKRFESSGYTKKQFERVKLHATVMNTLCRVDPNDSSENEFQRGDSANKTRESFDARNILKQFGDYDFGVYAISQLDISIRFTASSTGYYEALCSIKF